METSYTKQIKNEYKNYQNWFDQIVNIFSSLVWFLGTWISATTTTIGAILKGVATS